jgi:hypothetical protein
MTIIHWLFATENPFKLWGFFPALVWIAPMCLIAIYFAGFETLGVLRFNGMVPLTWVWRCAPRIVWFIAAGLSIWHFAFVVTKVK